MPSRLLVAVGEAAQDPDSLPFGVRTLLQAADEVLVVAPALPTRLQWLASDTDRASERADERLAMVLGQLGAMGTPARGQVGSDDPLLAFEDAIRAFGPDHLLVALRSDQRKDWQERGLTDRLLESFGLPVTVFVAAG